MDENKEKEEGSTNPNGDNTSQNKKEVVKSKAILVDEGSIIKPTPSGVAMVLKYDFIREVRPEYKKYSNEELRGILSQCSQEELHKIFASGIKNIVEEELIKVLAPAEKKHREAVQRKAEEAKKIEEWRKARAAEEAEFDKIVEEARKAEEEKNKRKKWFIIPLIVILGGITLSSCPVKDPYPLQPDDLEKEESTDIKEEEDNQKDDEDIEETVTQVKHDSFTIYKPDDSTQLKKAVTDYRNQESASNDRRKGNISDGQDEWDREQEAMENYDKNKENIAELEECIEILKSDTATVEEKREALRKMREPSREVSESFDSEEMQGVVQEAIEQSQINPDEITAQETQIALEMQEAYETQKRCQESNVKVLMYIEYLEENGYEIGDIEVKENDRGDLTVSVTSSRTIDKSKANTGTKSFDEYLEALDEYLESDPEHDMKDFNNYLQEEENTIAESSKVETAKSGVFSKEEYEEMIATRDPIKVLEATDKLIAAMKDQKNYTTTTELGNEDISLTISQKNHANLSVKPTGEKGDESRSYD